MLFAQEWCRCIKATCFRFLSWACKDKTALIIYNRGPRITTQGWHGWLHLEQTHKGPWPSTSNCRAWNFRYLSKRNKPAYLEHFPALSHTFQPVRELQGNSAILYDPPVCQFQGSLLSSWCQDKSESSYVMDSKLHVVPSMDLSVHLYDPGPEKLETNDKLVQENGCQLPQYASGHLWNLQSPSHMLQSPMQAFCSLSWSPLPT